MKLLLTKSITTSMTDEVLVEKCKELIQTDWEIEVIHIYKEANTVADGVTNWALQQQIGYHLLPSYYSPCSFDVKLVGDLISTMDR